MPRCHVFCSRQPGGTRRSPAGPWAYVWRMVGAGFFCEGWPQLWLLVACAVKLSYCAVSRCAAFAALHAHDGVRLRVRHGTLPRAMVPGLGLLGSCAFEGSCPATPL
eukprot:9635666-Alexandrium_andersonii.AAC.1